MQRKIIKQGNNSYTVTLPKKWIDKNGIGDFVFVEEIDNSLYIKASELIPVKLVNVDTPIDNASRFRTLLAAIYRRGFSRVTFTNIILSRVTILSVLSSFQSGSSLNPKSATEIEIEFSDSRDSSFVEATINRLFFITELLFTAQKSEVEYLKAEAIKLRDYALRLIHINNYGDDASYEYSNIVFILEKICGLLQKKSYTRHLDTFKQIGAVYRLRDLPKSLELNGVLSNLKKNDSTILPEYLFTLSSRIVGICI